MKDSTKLTKPSSSISGFTLVESLVAITVLLLAITAPLQIAYRGIAQTVLCQKSFGGTIFSSRCSRLRSS
jgi:prepilin-type N-terminal cleavage/methylation domain-containing protein